MARQMVCPSCGEADELTDLEQRPQPTTACSRGTQVSIVGWRQIPLCVTCDATMLSRSLAGKLIPNGYVPAAVRRRDSDRPDPGQHTILPR